MSEVLLAALIVLALLLPVAFRQKWSSPKRYPPRDDESPLSWRRPVDVLIVLVALAALLGGVLWLAGWRSSLG